MKKLLVVALLAASIVSIADARCGKNRCAPKKSECEPCVKTQCIRPACIVGVDSTCDEGCMPDQCGAVPARRNVLKHVHTSVSYSCAPLEGCAVPATEEQVQAWKDMGSIPDTTTCR